MNQRDPEVYVSGMGKESTVPPEIHGWNWGAFLLNWIWGLGNSTYIALLMFVPLVNFVMPFVLGAKGSEWAWRNQAWRDVEHFKATQRKWAMAGVLVIVVFIPSCIGITMTAAMAMMKQTAAFQLSLGEIRKHEEVIAMLGEPIATGLFVSGNVSTSGPDGEAALQYTVKGPKAEGQAIVYAERSAGRWELKQVVVDVADGNQRITVVAPE